MGVMMTEALAQDLEAVRALKAAGVFLDVDNSKRDLSKGAIVVRCSDCDQRDDMVGYIERMFAEQGHRPRIHDFALNGGPKVIPVDSPLNPGDRRGSSIIEDIHGAHILKGINQVMIFGHNPCGAAKMRDVSLAHVIDILMQAEGRIKVELGDKIENLHVHAFVHIDWAEIEPGTGRPKKRTYFVSYNAWLAVRDRFVIASTPDNGHIHHEHDKSPARVATPPS